MKQILKTDSTNFVSSLRAMIDLVEGKANVGSAMDAAKKFSGLALGGELGAATALGRNDDPALSQPNKAKPQDPATRGSGYATDANPGYNYKPYQPPVHVDGPGIAPPSQSGQSADNLLNPASPYSAPDPKMHQFNISDTPAEPDDLPAEAPGMPGIAPSTMPADDLGGPSDLDKAPLGPTGPIDKLGGPSDLDKAPPPTLKQHMNKPPHPAGLPKTPKAKFDPAVQKLQYELQAKGYPIKADGFLGPQTQKVLDWEHMSTARNDAIQDFGALQTTMDEPINTPDEPIDNSQGDFDRMPELNESTELHRILQIAQWR
jgi:hypothetical protein